MASGACYCGRCSGCRAAWEAGEQPDDEILEGRDSQHVLKAEGASPDATDREHAPMASPDGGPMGAGQAAAAAPTGDTEKPMRGTWKLIRPDGRTYHASSPIQCLRTEQTERIPPHVALQRIMEAATSHGDSEMLDWLETNNGAWCGSEKPSERYLYHSADWTKRTLTEAHDLRSAIRAAMEKDKQP